MFVSQVFDRMCRRLIQSSILLLLGFPFFPVMAQSTQTPAGKTPSMTTEKAIDLAQQGRCKEALPALKRGLSGPGAADMKKQAGIMGLRCALGIDDRESAAEFLRQLQKNFPKDPDVLFVVVHGYSDLSSRAAQDLGRFAPESTAAHKLNAEALEMQGKWDEAQREYEEIIQQHPDAAGIHYLLGRSLLSRPDADAKAAERAKQEFSKELEIDPRNAGAAYVLGELAEKEENWDEAIARFSQAAKLDSGFAEAYLGWGSSLVTVKRYQDAIPPLQTAERLAPWNPTVHYDLGTALSRTGHKEEADKEFAIHRNLTAKGAAQPPADKPQ